MSDMEKIDFIVAIKGEFWDKRPMYKITINDDEVFPPTEFDLASGQVKEVKVSKEFSASGSDTIPGVLKVHLLNKEPSDTKKDQYDNPDNFEIVADMLLTVTGLEIDGIVLPVGSDYSLTDDVGYYEVNEPVAYRGESDVRTIPGCNVMGWNGAYCFNFKTPIYVWILDQFK